MLNDRQQDTGDQHKSEIDALRRQLHEAQQALQSQAHATHDQSPVPQNQSNREYEELKRELQIGDAREFVQRVKASEQRAAELERKLQQGTAALQNEIAQLKENLHQESNKADLLQKNHEAYANSLKEQIEKLRSGQKKPAEAAETSEVARLAEENRKLQGQLGELQKAREADLKRLEQENAAVKQQLQKTEEQQRAQAA